MAERTSNLGKALDDLATNPNPGGGPVCAVQRILDALPEADRTKLAQFIDEYLQIPASEIARALRDEGHLVSSVGVQRHRRRAKGTGCGCKR